MYKNVHKYLSHRIDTYVRPKGLRKALISILRLLSATANGAETVDAFGITSKHRPSFSTVTIDASSIKPFYVQADNGVVAGDHIVAGQQPEALYKYAMYVKDKHDVTLFAKCIGSADCAIRGIDFIEKDGLYLFKKHPGAFGIRVPTATGVSYVFVTVGGRLCSQHNTPYHAIIPDAVDSYNARCINKAIASAALSLTTPSCIISAITGEGVVLEDGVVSRVWSEGPYTYMLLTNNVLHRASTKGNSTVAAGDTVCEGSLWYKQDVDMYIKYDVEHDCYKASAVPDINIKTIPVNVVQKDAADIRSLDKLVLKESNVVLLQHVLM